jgi:hypothetical protein
MNVRPAIKTTMFCLRMDPQIKHEAERAAADQQRTLAGLIEFLLVQHFQQPRQSAAARETRP